MSEHTPNFKTGPVCRHCGESLPVDSSGRKKFPGLVCLSCKRDRLPKASGVKPAGPRTEPLRSKRPIRSRSKKRAAEDARYRKEAQEFLLRFPRCSAHPVLKGRPGPADQVHHQRGRRGVLLLDRRFWLPVCAFCHDWIHRNPEEARGKQATDFGLKLLCARGDWENPTLKEAGDGA